MPESRELFVRSEVGVSDNIKPQEDAANFQISLLIIITSYEGKGIPSVYVWGVR